ncbi:MAG TPA: MFS transporter [Candidatus Gemmiger stercoravium]|nr:MFS transporter [Candidatus Gemmiger stercoravium]
MAKTKNLDANGYRKFGWLDRISYAAGDFGCNMSFALKGSLTVYWTQFMGINQILMAGLLLLVQVWDAINDPLIGSMVDADRRHYKRNKFLAYINVGAIGLTVAGALCFLPFPGLPEVAECIMFVAGYIIWDAFYTVANVPYGSLLSLITDDPAQRAEISSFRSAGAMVAGILTGILIPVVIYDANNVLIGQRMFWMALIMGGIGLLCFQFMIRTTEIRVNTEVKVGEEAPKFNFLVAMKNFFRNRPAVGATLSAVAVQFGMYGAQTATTVLFQAYFGNAQISGAVGMLSYLGLFLFMPFVKPLVNKLGKKEGCIIGGIITCFAYVLMLVLPITPDAKGIGLFVFCQIIAAIGNGFGTCVGYAMMADAMDYEEWKFGERNEGTTYAMHSFFRKLAQGVGPSLGIVLATWLGYNATLGPDQPAAVALNMRYLTPTMYLIGGVLSLVSYGLIYNLDRKTLNTMKGDLEARHAAH